VLSGAALAVALGAGCQTARDSSKAEVDGSGTVDSGPKPPARTDPEGGGSLLEPFVPAADCAELAARAERFAPDAALLGSLCPEHPIARHHLRAELLGARSPGEAHGFIARLDEHPELQGLARLASLDRSSHALPERVAHPRDALVFPIDEAVLANVTYALAAQIDRNTSTDERTRARAYLARVHIQAFQSLGLERGQPLPPLAQLLAARALYHGRHFCRDYWRRRVLGLEDLFAETEVTLLELVLHLQGTPHLAQDAMLAVERQRTLRYLRGQGPRTRIEQRLAQAGPGRPMISDLEPFLEELDRLADHGFVDLAVARATAVSRDGGPPAGALEAEVAAILEKRDMRDYLPRMQGRFADATSQPGKPDPATVLDARRPSPWPSAQEVATDGIRYLVAATVHAPGSLARRHALARALSLLKSRPDAARILLRVDALGPFHGLLESMVRARDDSSLATLRVLAPDYRGTLANQDDPRRLAYALATRDAGLQHR
jgi:hypothetical protein